MYITRQKKKKTKKTTYFLINILMVVPYGLDTYILGSFDNLFNGIKLI